MTGDRDTIIRAAKAAGYRRVNTAAGPVDLDDWQPYGATKGDPRSVIGTVTFTLIVAEKDPRIALIVDENPRIEDARSHVWLLGQ